MKNTDKRLEKLMSNLPTGERVVAILDALREGSRETANALMRSAPIKSYDATDADVTATVDAIFDIGGRFDVAIYKLLSEYNFMLGMRLVGQVREAGTKSYSKEYQARIGLLEETELRCLDEISSLIVGAETLADCVGLSLEKILVCSVAFEDDNVAKHFDINPATRERISDRAKKFADVMDVIWCQDGHSLRKVA